MLSTSPTPHPRWSETRKGAIGTIPGVSPHLPLRSKLEGTYLARLAAAEAGPPLHVRCNVELKHPTPCRRSSHRLQAEVSLSSQAPSSESNHQRPTTECDTRGLPADTGRQSLPRKCGPRVVPKSSARRSTVGHTFLSSISATSLPRSIVQTHTFESKFVISIISAVSHYLIFIEPVQPLPNSVHPASS